MTYIRRGRVLRSSIFPYVFVSSRSRDHTPVCLNVTSDPSYQIDTRVLLLLFPKTICRPSETTYVIKTESFYFQLIHFVSSTHISSNTYGNPICVRKFGYLSLLNKMGSLINTAYKSSPPLVLSLPNKRNLITFIIEYS